MQFRLILILLMLSIAACSSAPSATDAKLANSDEQVVWVQPQTLKLKPADRVEVVLVRPDFWPHQQHYRAIVGDDGSIELPRLGRFSASDKTIRALERDVLATFNNQGRLRGSVRVMPAPISLNGFFITPSIHDFGLIMADAEQVAQLDRNEHAMWQWVGVAMDAPINKNGHMDLMTIQRKGARWTIARPAHPELVSDRLTANIDNAISTSPGWQIKLKPAAAIAMENVTRQNNGGRMLLVMNAQAMNIPHIQAMADHQIRITTEGDFTGSLMQLLQRKGRGVKESRGRGQDSHSPLILPPSP